jgi:hypothetical protein
MDDAPDMSSMATDDNIARGKKMARKFVVLDSTIDALEARLKIYKEQRTELARKELPDFFMNTLKTDKIGVPEAGVDVVIEPFYHANIRADWPPEQRREAFDYLEQSGDGDVVSVVLTCTFGRKELAEAKELERLILDSRFGNTNPPVLEMGVPWNTLTSLVRKKFEGGKSVDLEKLGATIGRQAKVKKRK